MLIHSHFAMITYEKTFNYFDNVPTHEIDLRNHFTNELPPVRGRSEVIVNMAIL